MDRRIIRTKKAIKTALLTLIKEKKLSEITVTELAEKADIDRRTFYFHYSTPTDIFKEIEDDIFETLNQRVHSLRDFNLGDFLNEINTGLNENFDFFYTVSMNDQYYSLLRNSAKKFKCLLEEFFQKKSGLRNKEFSVCAGYISGGIITAYIEWMQDENKCSLAEFSKNLEKTIYDGWNLMTGQ